MEGRDKNPKVFSLALASVVGYEIDGLRTYAVKTDIHIVG